MENSKSKDEALCAVIMLMALYMTVSLGLKVFFDSRPTGGERFVLLIVTVFFGKMAWLAGRKLAILQKRSENVAQ